MRRVEFSDCYNEDGRHPERIVAGNEPAVSGGLGSRFINAQ